MNFKTVILASLIFALASLLVTPESLAGKEKCTPWPECRDDGGDPPPPTDGCTDIFPAFVYHQPGTRRISGETRLSSSEGCRTELVVVPEVNARMHMTADRTAGVFVSSGGENQYSFRRQDFTVNFTQDPSGALTVEEAVTITLPGVALLPGDNMYYEVQDVWGDADHDSLYIAVMRIRDYSEGEYAGSSTREFLIYDLNDLTNNRTIYRQVNTPSELIDWDRPAQTAAWLTESPETGPNPINFQDCTTVQYPQFSPICYSTGFMRFNPSGTRLYFDQGLRWQLQDSDVNLWQSTMRLNLNRLDDVTGDELPVAGWNIIGPEMVAVRDHSGSGGWGEDAIARPGTARYTLPTPEIVAAGGQFYDADQCVSLYSPYTDGNTGLTDYHWELCNDDSLFANGANPGAWDSPDSYLTTRFAVKGKNYREIYRVHVVVSTGDAGTEELLIVNGADPDTGQ